MDMDKVLRSLNSNDDDAQEEEAKPTAPDDVIASWTEVDLTARARQGLLEPAYGIDDAIERVALMLRAERFPVLVGSSGVGKTALVHELVRRCEENGDDSVFGRRRVIQISIRQHAASLKKETMLGASMHQLIDALSTCADQVVPFFRDIDAAYRFDCEPHLHALALRLQGMCIGEGSQHQIQAMFDHMPGLEERYHMIPLFEPKDDVVREMIDQWVAYRQHKDSCTFEPAAIDLAVDLSDRFLARNAQPRRILDVLRPLTAESTGDGVITPSVVVERFCSTHQVPRHLVDPQMMLDLAVTRTYFEERILGQPDAVDAVMRMIALIKAGLADPRRPFGVFLFSGPSGVGKTHLAQLLASYMFGRADRIVRLNMADYADPMAAKTVFGDPHAMSVWDRRGVLHRRLTGYPFAVVLLDEFEKADGKVHDAFLQLFDEGSFINGNGEVVSCRSSIIIATSNAGSEVYRVPALGFVDPRGMEELAQEVDRKLRQMFRFEFLNRFDAIVHFRSLGREAIRIIARRELEALEQRSGFKRSGYRLDIDEEVIDWLAAHGFDPHYGARFLRRAIARNVTTVLADTLVSEPGRSDGIDEGGRIRLSVRGAKIQAIVQPSSLDSGELRLAALISDDDDPTIDSSSFDEKTLKARLSEIAPQLEKARQTVVQNRQQREELLQLMNDEEFWNRAPHDRVELEQYRSLDVQLQVQTRLVRPMEEALEALGSDDAVALRRALPRAEQALVQWQERDAAMGNASIWLVLGPGDVRRGPGEWLDELVSMELAWCKRQGLDARIAAWNVVDEAVQRFAIEVEGPGAEYYLSMEHGTHRRHRGARVDRVRVEVVPRLAKLLANDARVRQIRTKKGPGPLVAHAKGTLQIKDRGITQVWLAEQTAELSLLFEDLLRAWSGPPADTPEPARIYNLDGTAARDPRTNAMVRRTKDVARGRLERLFRAWRKLQ